MRASSVRRRGGRWTAAVVAAAAMVVTGAGAQEAPRPIEIMDMFRLRSVGSPAVSPEGEWVAYTIGHADYDEGRRYSRIWMQPIGGGEAIPMTMEGLSAGSPRWSPDGKWLSFSASRQDGETQVWALDRRGGEARQLTSVKQGIDGFAWSPDGKRLLLEITDDELPWEAQDEDDEGDAESDDEDEGDDEGDDDEPRPFIIDRLQFKQDYSGYLDRLRTHLYVWELDSGALTQLTSGDQDDGSAAWSPDGRRIVFTSNRTDEPDSNDNSDLWIIDVPGPAASQAEADARTVPTPRRLTTNAGSDGSPVWSPDGRWIAYTRNTRPDLIWYGTSEIAVISPEGGEPRSLTAGLDRNVYGLQFDPEGRLWFIIEDSGEQHLARIRVDGRGLERVVTGERVVGGYHIGGEGRIALELSDPTLPGDLFVLDRRGPRRLTTVNDTVLAGLRLGEVRNFHSRSRDGTEIEGWITLPPDYVEGRRYPTLLRIHGGPVSQYDWSFEFESQLFAANGYVVVRSNPRGSSGYGTDFSAQLFADWGNKDFEDVMSAVDWAIAQGFSDPDRLGVGGWSYGGILTNYVITKTDRFEGAITGASEVFYRANYGHDHYQQVWVDELGLPWGETAELWDRLSPFTYVENIVTPTLIMGGAEDWNVPIHNSEQLYQALKKLGRETILRDGKTAEGVSVKQPSTTLSILPLRSTMAMRVGSPLIEKMIAGTTVKPAAKRGSISVPTRNDQRSTTFRYSCLTTARNLCITKPPPLL